MASRREVLDSDDEDSLSPLRGPTPEPLSGDEAATHNVNDGPDTSRSRRAESTDPSFFRNIYEEHHVATNGHILANSSIEDLGSDPRENPRPSSITSPVAPTSKKHDSSHVSSITDPVAGNRERRMAKKQKAGDSTFTQVTTPGRPQPSAGSDIWDIPPTQNESTVAGLSNSTSSGKKSIFLKAKTTGVKRKSDLSSSVQTPTSLETGSLPALSVDPADGAGRPANNKRRRLSEVQQGHGSQDVDMLVIPRSEETVKTSPTVPNTSSSDVIEKSDKPQSVSLFIVRNTLTPSQKEQYKFVSLSTEADETPEKIIRSAAADKAEALGEPSGTSITAHSTSDIPDSTLPAMPPAAEPRSSVLMKTLAKMKKRPKPVEENPRSSPDIISEPLKDSSKANNEQASSRDIVPPVGENSSAMPSTISPPSARRRRDLQLAGEDPFALPSTISPPPSSGIRRGRATQAREPKAVPEANIGSSLVPEQVEPPKRGRGRPKRLRSGTIGEDDDLQAAIAASLADVKVQKNNSEVNVAATSVTVVAEARTNEETFEVQQKPEPPVDEPVIENQDIPTPVLEQPQTKKKRGRKKKETTVVETVPQDDSVILVPDDPPVPVPHVEAEGPKPKRKRGRPRKSELAVLIEAESPRITDGEPDNQEAIAADSAVDTNDKEKKSEDTTAKETSETTGTGNETCDDRAMTVLSERNNNALIGGPQSKSEPPMDPTKDTMAQENREIETPMKQVTKKDDTPKSGILSSQVRKVQYRVGLSKKSRIAPLLKSVRKP